MSEPLSLNCYLLGSDSSEVFTVEILRTENVSCLKDLIKEKQSPHLNHIAASKLTVWKVSLPVDAITSELTVADVGGRQDLHSVKRISAIFDEALVDEHVHVLVRAPIRPETLCLNYLLLGRSLEVFTVKILETERVCFLKDLIKQKQSPHLDHVAASKLILSQVSLPVDNDLEESIKNVDLIPLKQPLLPVSEVFPCSEGNRLHIVVQAPTNAIRQKRTLPESDSIFSRLKRSKIATTAPSTIANPDVYKLLQRDPSEKIFDDRPIPDPDIPSVALLYEGFGHFLDIMDGRDDVPGLADIVIKRLYSEVDTLASKIEENYENEDNRRDAILPCLTRIFSARKGIQIPELHADPIGSIRTGGHNIAPHGAGTIVVECKNNIAGINGNPQVEFACCIAHLYSTKVDERLYLGWRTPCLGLTIVGCKLTFYAAIAIDYRFKLVNLTPTFSCIQSASDGHDRKSLYLAFMAASVLQAHIIQDAENFRNNLPREIPLKARRFPVVTKLRKYPSPSDDDLNFEIRDVFRNAQPYPLLYIATTSEGQLILIKFVRQCSIELHHFCAESGHAPRILAFERLPGGWYAVAMEFSRSRLPITAPHRRDCWAKELQCLVDSLHLEGLLDFDWGGTTYSANLNNVNELQEGR